MIPWSGGPLEVQLECSEFTSHCPVTGQPDFARLVIRYTPDKHLVETKSLKLYLWSFREAKAYNEALCDEVAHVFDAQVQPKSVTVEAMFHARGGISVTARAARQRGGT